MNELRAATRTAPRRWRQWLREAAVRLLPRRWLLASGSARCGAVCLTFDDGPDPATTPAILDILAAEGVRASFFVLGERAAAHPDLVRRIRAEGHGLGHHSWSHGRPEQTSARALALEARRCRAWLREHTGEDSRWFRPPHGKLSVAKLAGLWASGMAVVLWSLDPGDVSQPDAAAILAWLERHPARSGDILLLHDTCASTVTALPALIAGIRAQGLRFATLNESMTPGKNKHRRGAER